MSITGDPAGRARIDPSWREVSRSSGAVRERRAWRGPGSWRRARLAAVARWQASRLDRDLAAGVSPRTSDLLELRARAITGRRSRLSVARGLARALRSAQDGSRGFTAAVPPDRREALAARTVIEALERRLRGAAPVTARGMAMLRELLVEPTSALYRPDERGALGSQLRAAAAGLEPGNRWD